jgi:hypothetical protein
MNLYFKSVVVQLRNYSLSLNKKSVFVDKPWTLIDDEGKVQRLIFEYNGQLVISQNGRVQRGSWEYFPVARSILIDRVTDKILLNEAYIDNGVMILKMDGTENKFFVFTNENMVPDLDARRHLSSIRRQRLNICIVKLLDGRTLEVQREDTSSMPIVGDPATFDAIPAEDGKYQKEDKEKYIEVKNGRIYKIITQKTYINPDGKEIVIEQKNSWNILYGDDVYMYGKQIEDGIINFTDSKNLVVRGGKVVRLERKNLITRFMSNSFKKFFGDYYE